FAFWHSSQRFYPGSNLALYSNKHADDLIDSIRKNFDPQTRAGAFRDLQNTIVGEHPAIFLYSPSYFYVTANDLRGLQPQLLSDPAERFADVEHWFVKTTRAWK